ncbi:MAG: DNA repair protein RecO [Thiohalophilus sp.]|uniref:DNA repair protein RecO n=1 Tax=Thiohalophilus sp. TaxID=3028392 RepID=UPI0028708818|nr:DNA repair protein RecO [Thiohalophilus sp.]MDR9436929.1 DNA repair protein RecO [Thiohalophilus sp.]
MATEHRQQLQYGFILHSRPYRDTSSLLDIFTRDGGRVSLVARGVRGSRSRNNARLEAFVPLLFSWVGRGELRTMTAVESGGAACSLPGSRIISGFYMNELILRLLHRDDPHPELFACYESALRGLLDETVPQEAVLRRYERELLDELGYGLQLAEDVHSGEPLQADTQYCYHPEQGPIAQVGSQQREYPVISGQTLLAIRANDYREPGVLREAKILMRFLLSQHLDNRPLKSRELYWQSRDL